MTLSNQGSPLREVGRGPSAGCPADVETLLSDTLDTLCDALRHHLQAGSGLWDPQDRAPTPADHYGLLASTLALRLLEAEGSRWQEPFAAWMALPRGALGHHPFNRLLSNLLGGVLQEAGAPAAEQRLVAQARRRCPLEGGYPSNNWTLLARACRILEAGEGGLHGRWARDRYARTLRRWMTPAGGFIDYPAHPRSRTGGATPIAYHHKALFLTRLVAVHTNDESLHGLAHRLEAWAFGLWDGGGHVGGFGRTNHGLFGDACLAAALVLGGAGGQADEGRLRLLEGLLQRWQRQRRGDGFLELTPSGSGWDNYMHLSVYNAWTVAILAWARWRAQRGPAAPLKGFTSPGMADTKTDEVAGLLRLGDPEGMLALWSSRGQPPQSFSSSWAEMRYGGGLPFHMTWHGIPLCPPPVRVPLNALEQQPALAGWTPVLRVGRALYALNQWVCRGQQGREGAVELVLRGHPVPLVRSRPEGLGGRILSALDWRLLQGRLGRRAALQRRALVGIEAGLRVRMRTDRPVIRMEMTLRNRLDRPVTLLNPCGHATLRDPRPSHRRGTWCLENGASREVEACEGWQVAAQEATLPGAEGHCLASREIPASSAFTQEIGLEWLPAPVRG
ncbi:MAG: hypothetical protein ACLFTM_06335 [Ectothiorhodospira sp.]